MHEALATRETDMLKDITEEKLCPFVYSVCCQTSTQVSVPLCGLEGQFHHSDFDVDVRFFL